MSFIPKVDFIKDIILLILYSLVFIFLSYILYKVNRADKNSHRSTINMMIVCLMLSVLCKFSFPIIYFSLIYFRHALCSFDWNLGIQ